MATNNGKKKNDCCCGKTVTETNTTVTEYGTNGCHMPKGTLQYIGARYVPVFADPVKWSADRPYEHLMMVQNSGNTYISKQAVPVGIELPITTGENEYWILFSNYSAQLEQYRQEVERLSEDVDSLQHELESVEDSVNDSLADMRFLILPKHGVVAHRGYKNIAPENSRAAYIEAGLAGAHMCEADLQPTSDGKLICMHDGNMNRTTGIKARCWDYTLSDITNIKLIDNAANYPNETVPTFEEYLTICFDYGMTPNIELKRGYPDYDSAIAEMFKILDQFNARYKVCIHSWGDEILDMVKAKDPLMFCSFVTRMTSHDDVQAVIDKYDGIYFELSAYNGTWLKELHDAGKYVTSFTGAINGDWPVSQPYINAVVCDNPFENVANGSVFNNEEAAFSCNLVGKKPGSRYTVYSNNLLAPYWFERGIVLNEVSKTTDSTSKNDCRFPSTYLGKFDSYDVVSLDDYEQVPYLVDAENNAFYRLINDARGTLFNLFSWSPEIYNSRSIRATAENAQTFAMQNYGGFPMSGRSLMRLADSFSYRLQLSNKLRSTSKLVMGGGWNIAPHVAQTIAPGFFINNGAFYPCYGYSNVTIDQMTYSGVAQQPQFIVRTCKIVDNEITTIKDYSWKNSGDSFALTNNEGTDRDAFLIVVAVPRWLCYGAASLPTEDLFYLLDQVNNQTCTLS